MKSLQQFPDKIQKSAVTGSVRAAAVVVQKEMKSRVPYNQGTLEGAIRVKKYRSKKTEVIYNVGIAKVVYVENGQTKNTKAVAFWQEFGTKNTPSQPFIRPSLHGVGNRPVEAARTYFEPRMKKEAKKLGFGI